MKTYLIKAIAALGFVSVLAVAAAAPSSAEPIYHGYPLHGTRQTVGNASEAGLISGSGPLLRLADLMHCPRSTAAP
jgi:hypothetical protein